MRILHFLPVYAPAWQYGGPILSVSRLCEGLVRQGVDVRVITTNAGLPYFPIDQLSIPQNVNGVQVTYYPVDKQDGTIRSTELVKALPGQMAWAELLHLSSIWQPLGLSVQRAAHLAGVPVIHTLRGALGPYSWNRGWWKKIPYFLFMERPLLQRANLLHCTTHQEAAEIAWLHLKPPIDVVPNPLDLSQLFPNPEIGRNWRMAMDLPLEIPLIIVVGRLHHKKGLDLLPKALNLISDLPWNILFVGHDNDHTYHKLRRAFSDLGLLDRCHWLETLPSDELIGPYNAADWLLLPSRHENFGNVVAEALACGCGAIISNKVGISASVEMLPNVHILPRDYFLWGALLKHLLTKKNTSKEPLTGHLDDMFSRENIALSFISIYNRIIKSC